jgi:serine/threonine protein kinase
MDVIAHGTFGTVYRAQRAEETVAIKVVPLDRMRSIDHEIAIHAELAHTNIVLLVETFHAASPSAIGTMACHVVLEYCHTDVQRLMLARKVLHPDEVRPLAGDLVAALRFLHEECRVIHRDVKLSNLLLTRDGTLKLADFGVAARLTPGLTRRSFCGTVHFMAPEVFVGSEQGPARDAWAVGCVVYNLLTGRSPFVGATRAETCARIQQCDYDLDGSLDDDAVAFIQSVLRPMPADRSTVRELELQPFLACEGRRLRIACSEDEVEEPSTALVTLARATGETRRAPQSDALLLERRLRSPKITRFDSLDRRYAAADAEWRDCAAAAEAAVDAVDSVPLPEPRLRSPIPAHRTPLPPTPRTPVSQLSSLRRRLEGPAPAAASPDSIVDSLALAALSPPTPLRRPVGGSAVTLESRGDINAAVTTRWVATLRVDAKAMGLRMQYNDAERTRTVLTNSSTLDADATDGSDFVLSGVAGATGEAWTFELRRMNDASACVRTLALARHAMRVLHLCLDVERDTIAAAEQFPVRRIVQVE